EPKTISDQDKLKDALSLLSKEDPTFTIKESEETGQLIISGMGELHLDVLVTRILREYKIGAKVGNPQVTYRESISAVNQHTENFSKILAGKENSAGITLKVEPGKRGQGNLYINAAKKSSNREAPENILEAISRGINGSFASGIVMGYPCIDITVTVTDIQYSELTGTEFAFEACASMAFDEACRNASPILLEPIMAVDLNTPHEFVGEVMSCVTQRGGQILNMNAKADEDEIKAQAPMRQMFGFMTSLRSVSQGRANFSLAFSHFEKQN
ncbi:MAG: elongation factor G, partial [Treponema sp.]|nr:elongation factor G [Treponema sp.]